MWSEIVGHKKQIEELKRTIVSHRIPNAFLFSGFKGIGKYLTACTFVQAVYCRESPDVCGVCISCAKIKKKQHPDVFFVEAKTNKILIEQIRQLNQNLQFHPLEGLYKAAIIDDADEMTDAAANSLLKLLEEPPPRTFFILVSSFPHSLLPTIRSRCRHLAFSPLTKEEVMCYLKRKIGIGEENAKAMAALSQGSIGSIAMLDDKFMEDVLTRFKSIVTNANTADIISLASLWSQDEERFLLILDLLAVFYRNIIFHIRNFAHKGEEKEIILNMGRTALERLKGKSIEQLEDDFVLIMKTRDIMAKTTANKQLMFEQLLFTLTA